MALWSNCSAIRKEHGIKTASVPWSYPGSRFTKDFDMTATFLAMSINKKVTAEYLRCDWHTIMRCISRARSVLEPDIKKRYDGLVNIGIDCKFHFNINANPI